LFLFSLCLNAPAFLLADPHAAIGKADEQKGDDDDDAVFTDLRRKPGASSRIFGSSRR